MHYVFRVSCLKESRCCVFFLFVVVLCLCFVCRRFVALFVLSSSLLSWFRLSSFFCVVLFAAVEVGFASAIVVAVAVAAER